MSRAAHRRLGLLTGALVLAGAFAAEAAVDGELLEFLGSIDAEGDGWSAYLERTDVDRATRPPAPPPEAQPPQPPAERQVQKP